MTIPKCQRATFTQDQYDQCHDQFWSMPARLGHPAPTGEPPLLARAWAAGKSGALALLPSLGIVAGLERRGDWTRSREEYARLGGCDRKSLRTGARALEDLGVVEATWMRYHEGVPVTTWSVHPSLAASQPDGAEYFRFAAPVLHGGHWAMMPGPLKALYLGAAVHAHRTTETPDAHTLLRYVVRRGVDRRDLERAHETTGGLRLARVTYAQLEATTGVSEGALKRAASAAKFPEHWGDRSAAALPHAALEYAALAIYPVEEGALVFHFRDHATPWPWEVLNRRVDSRSAVQTTMCTATATAMLAASYELSAPTLVGGHA